MTKARGYRSALREKQALETRLRLRQTARRLFESKGFATTTIAEIAGAAEVSPQTVYAVFESKAGLVLAMLEEMEEGGQEAAWAARIEAESDPRRQLSLFAAFNRSMFEQGATILRALAAARGAPEVDAATRQGDMRRREGTRRLAKNFAERGLLRPGLGIDDAADRLWLLSSPEQYLNATDGAGWTPKRYERWLAELLEREVLAPA
jgi:AcrR family transcriptional regulator